MAKAADWSLQPTPDPVPQTKSQLEDISCPTTAMCMAIGNDRYLGKGFVEVWKNSEWKIAKALGGEVKAVSCPTATFCAVVAKNENGAWRLKAFEYLGGGWSVSTDVPAVPAGADNVSLRDISCTAEAACTAVGLFQAETGEWKAHAERWDGTSWSPQIVPSPQGETALNGVSCTSATSCVAVGSVQVLESGSYRPRTQIARWDGAAWSLDSAPDPAGATSSALRAVSCVSPTICMAIGTYSDNSSSRPFAMRLDGSSWSVHATAAPADAKGAVQLHSVACTTATTCVAVGQYVSVAGSFNLPAQERTLVERWDGAGWSVQASPNPAEEEFSALTGVSCSSETVCTAVGKSRPAKAEEDIVTLGMRWAGEVWSLQPTPDPVPQTKSQLEDISCPTTAMCMAIGNDRYLGKGFVEVWK
ncbi:MAG TPA: hypothetical protein VN179_01985, partial [Solirubrobacterales bacterium]|nr:hypothetical protein [Solirubrobacterales bacterium]